MGKSLLQIEGDQVVFTGEHIQVIQRRFRTKSGKSGAWEIARRKIHQRIVSVFALTEDHRVILEKIFRVHVNGYVMELPGGLTDRKEESEEEAIRRELLEETGYAVDDIRLITFGPVNPRVFNDSIAVYFGNNARKTQEQELDDAEEIEVVLVPVRGLLDFLSGLP